MISNYQKVSPPPKQQDKTNLRQLNTCLLKRINNRNISSTLAEHPSKQSSPYSKETSTMSTLTQDLRIAAVAANNKPNVKPPLEAVVVNSIIYSKPSFCTIAVDLGDLSGGKKPLANSLSAKNIFHGETFCSPVMSLKTAASCLAGLAASSSSLHMGGNDAKIYRMCTTINGSIHHQISELCDNILAMAELFKDTNNKQDDDSLIEFNYDDEGDNYIYHDHDEDDEDEDDEEGEDNDDEVDDDDGEDFLDNEQVDYDEDLDEDNDVVDFSYECPVEPASQLNCDKKKKVRFNTKPTVHVMHTWNYAYRAARKGEWEMYARDRERFKWRIQRTALTLNPILEREHRQKIYEKRFANIYDNDDVVGPVDVQPLTKANNCNALAEIKENETSTTNIESKKPHQKKKRRKRRFCKMGNKHYF
ncbi:protein phosphatase 1 regulatory subunit 15 [Cochliomyia hominivorax]